MPQLSRYFQVHSCKQVLPLVFLCCLVTGGAAQGLADGGQEEEIRNPYAGDPKALEYGRPLFRKSCSSCHGINARGGGRGPNLTLGRWNYGGTDAALFRTIKNGVSGTEMPSSRHEDNEIWLLVAYLRTLGSESREPAPGDRKAGERIFSTQSNCSQCHMVGGKGGRLGPDFSRLGGSRSADFLVESVRKPSKNISDGYTTVTVAAKDGERITGVRKNEDTFSVQLMSADEQLHLFLKKDLQEVREESESLMPAYNRRMLSDQDLEDLVAYMSGLRSQ